MNKISSIMREDWIDIELGEILKVSSGSGLTAKKMTGSGYPVYGGNGITGYHSEYLFDEQKLIIGRVGVRCGVTHITKSKAWVTDNALVVTFKQPFFDLHFMKLKLQFENLNKLSNSTAQPVISGAKIYAYSTTIPSLPEQRAIVAKIEELFSDLDKGIADLKKAQDQLKVYRQAVLKKAFEGEAIKEAKKEKLIDITEKIGSGSTPKGGKKNYKTSGIPLVRSLNIHFDFIKYDELAFIDEEQAERLKNVIIQEGDVLLNITGASIGRVNIAPKDFENGRVNQHVSIIRPKNNSFLPIYLKYFLQSPSIQEWISNVNYGVTRQALTKSAQENLELPLPSLEEQHQIVQEIESRLSVCDKVEESITESLEKAKALRQSILKKAFEGTLLSEEEIAACKAAPDYEPASVLLEKIKAEQKK